MSAPYSCPLCPDLVVEVSPGYHVPTSIIPLIQTIWAQGIDVETWGVKCKQHGCIHKEDRVKVGFLYEEFTKFMNLTCEKSVNPYKIKYITQDMNPDGEPDWKLLCIVRFSRSFIETVMTRLKKNR